MRKDGELFVRGVFDLGVRRKPQAFAADAVNLWVLNPSLLIINELGVYNAMPRWRTDSAPYSCQYGTMSRPRGLRLRSHRQTGSNPENEVLSGLPTGR
jgi:hypothetical protein